jgi:hypothetical protein
MYYPPQADKFILTKAKKLSRATSEKIQKSLITQIKNKITLIINSKTIVSV